MTLPKDMVKPSYNFTYPSERPYYEPISSELGAQVVANPDNSGINYGIQDPKLTEPVGGIGSETGSGGSTP